MLEELIAFQLKLVAKLLLAYSDTWAFMRNGVVQLEWLFWFLAWLYPLTTLLMEKRLHYPPKVMLWLMPLSLKYCMPAFLLLYSSQQARVVLIFQSSCFWDCTVLAREVSTCGFGGCYYSFSQSSLKPLCPCVPVSRCVSSGEPALCIGLIRVAGTYFCSNNSIRSGRPQLRPKQPVTVS